MEEAVFPYHYLFIIYGKPGESVFVLYIIWFIYPLLYCRVLRRSYLAYQSNYFQGITGGGASHAPGTPLIYHIKQSIAKESARFSAKLSSRHNRGGASHAPGTPLIYRIKQSIAKESARFSAKLSSRHNRGGASHAPGSPFIYHIKPSIAKKLARLSDKFHQGIISPRRLAADRKLTNWLPSVIARFVLPGLEWTWQ